LPAQESAFFGGKGRGDHITPNPAGGSDFDFLGSDVPSQRASYNDGVRADVLAGHASTLSNHQHAPQMDIAIEGTLNPHTAAAADGTFPGDTWAENGCNPCGGSGFIDGCGGGDIFAFTEHFAFFESQRHKATKILVSFAFKPLW
jgi:hypothetical protein